MEKIKIQKYELLEAVKANEAIHASEFATALEGYRLLRIKALEENLEALLSRNFKHVCPTHIPPENHARDYARVVRMLEMSVEDTIELTEEEFSQYVMNEWHWQRAWQIGNEAYTKAARA